MTASTLRPTSLPAARWRPSWRLSTRLSLAFGLVLGLLLVITAVALHRMQRIDAHTTRMVEVNSSRIAVIQNLMNAVNEVSVGLLGVTLVIDEIDAQEQGERIGSALKHYRTARTQLSALTNDAQDGEALAALDKVAVDGLGRAEEVNTMLLSGNTNIGNTFRSRNPRLLQDEWLQQLNTLAAREAQEALAQHNAIQVEFALARQWLMGVAAAAIALSVLAGTLILRSVTRPLAQAIGHAQRIAQGDLTGEIVAARSDETGDLLTALARMQLQLRELVSSINASAGGITMASREIAQGNQDLSNRTEQAAADLQSTAVSVGALAGVVRASADSAAQADALARQGGEAAASVVSVMDEILSGAKRIADIVGVIDSIAFQTNILALNAAVEAAHAGAQGRGFAVVATEVRSLAQRVVTAAHDIKQLINHSLASAGSGAELARNAGDTMQNIVISVQKVTTTIGEVASAAGMQSVGIEEVSAAVARLDDMTQRNAALVEESAAAAQALEQQAVQLEELVGVFRAAPLHTSQADGMQDYKENTALAIREKAPIAIELRAV